MKLHKHVTAWASMIISLSLLSFSSPSWALEGRQAELTQRSAENQVKNLIKPILDQYCSEDCKLMGVKVIVDIGAPSELSPGFDDGDTKRAVELAPVSAQVKVLIDDKLGPISRQKLLDLLQQYLDTLEYPVRIDAQITHFPVPHGTEARIAAARSQIEKTFLANTNEIVQQFCPHSCILTDFNLQTEVVNAEEAQYAAAGEFIQEGDSAIKIKKIGATLLLDQDLTSEEQTNILQMIKLKNSGIKNLEIDGKTLRFPKPLITGNLSTSATALTQDRKIASNSKDTVDTIAKSASDSTTSNNSSMTNQEKNFKEDHYSRTEKIERVENGDAIQKELDQFKLAGMIFGCSALSLLLFIAFSTLRRQTGSNHSNVQRIIHDLTSDPAGNGALESRSPRAEADPNKSGQATFSRRYEIERIHDELNAIYAQNPKTAKYVFSKVLTEEGVETTAECIALFGEGIVIEMLRDPSLQTDLTELIDFYSKNPIELSDEEKLTLLKKLHSRTIAGKLAVLGNRSTHLFDFLAEMDGEQILELIKTESITVKAIILTQCDPQKRTHIYTHMDNEIRMNLLTELSRIDYLPKDYIYNVSVALKNKKTENPKLNTEALPGSEVLVGLLERTGLTMQKTLINSLENVNPESARTIKGKLISVDTLRFLRDGQLLEAVLSLKHDELLQFLKGAPESIRKTIFSKSPPELVLELEEELAQIINSSRELYQSAERKIINRVRIMANDGHLNLVETNDRMFSSPRSGGNGFTQSYPSKGADGNTRSGIAS